MIIFEEKIEKWYQTWVKLKLPQNIRGIMLLPHFYITFHVYLQ